VSYLKKKGNDENNQSRIYTSCRRCRRTLSDPESMMRGYGPICIEKINSSKKTKPGSLESYFDNSEKNNPKNWRGVLSG
jgi:hypothetical protein